MYTQGENGTDVRDDQHGHSVTWATLSCAFNGSGTRHRQRNPQSHSPLEFLRTNKFALDRKEGATGTQLHNLMTAPHRQWPVWWNMLQ